MRLTKWKWFRTSRRLYRANNGISISDLTWKLGHFEDADELLGIEWTTLAKILTKGFYTDNPHFPFVHPKHISLFMAGLISEMGTERENEMYLFIKDELSGIEYMAKDYGNGFALTKEELL